MKNIIFTFMLITTPALAQDMSKTESYQHAYQDRADGSSVYVGKCKTHEDYAGIKFSVSKTQIQSTVKPQNISRAEAQLVIKNMGNNLFMIMMERFFKDMYNVSTPAKKLQSFIDLVDDLTIEEIFLVTNQKDLNLIRMNVGYGGGNGGYLVLNKTKSGNYELMSETGDGDLNYCDVKVWGK